MRSLCSHEQKLRVCMYIRGVARLDPRVTRSANALLESGFLVSVLDIESESTRPVEETIRGMHVKHLHKPQWLLPTRFPMRLLRSLEKFLYSIFYLVQMPADIYHAHNENVLLPCFIVALLRRKPLIFEAYEMPLYVLEQYNRHLVSVITFVFKTIIQRCAGVIVVSPPIVQEMHDHYHISNVALVRNILPYRATTKSNRLREYLGLHATTHVVLYQGNLQPDRGLATLVRATKFLRSDIVVVLMGKAIGTTSDELQTLIAQEGVAERVKIIPPVPYEELLEWTASADIGIIISSPSYSMNTRVFLPNKLFEYMMAGLPILTSPLPAVEELLHTYDVGRVLSSLEPASIAQEINALLADRPELERMRHNALAAAQHDLNWEKESQHLLQLYHSILPIRSLHRIDHDYQLHL